MSFARSFELSGLLQSRAMDEQTAGQLRQPEDEALLEAVALGF